MGCEHAGRNARENKKHVEEGRWKRPHIKHEAACAGERLDEKTSVHQNGTERTGETGAVIRVEMEQVGAYSRAPVPPLSGSGIAALGVLSLSATRDPLDCLFLFSLA